MHKKVFFIQLCIILFFAGVMFISSSFAVSLLPHRAVYDVSLVSADQGAEISSVDGRMVYETTGSKCEGYAINSRLVAQITDTLGETVVTDFRLTTFETGDGERYDFILEDYINEELMREARGKAQRLDEEITVQLTKPDVESLRFPLQAVFPTRQFEDILQAAEEGKQLVQHLVYDGIDEGAKKLLEATTVIGAQAKLGKDELEGILADKTLAQTPFWRVTISYFDSQTSGVGEPLPLEVISFDMHDNGISRNIIMQYDGLSIKAQLSELDIFASSECD